MQFETPLFLLLLILLPLVIWLGWPSTGANRKREGITLLLRVIAIVCLVFSLAGFNLVRPTNDLAVVFLVDASDSIPATSQAAELNYVRSAMKNMGRNDQAAVVIFGGNALVERSMSAIKELGVFTSSPIKDQTNLEDAVRLGISLFPPEAARRMVILTDGLSTQGDAEAAANLAAGDRIQIMTIAAGGPITAEAMVTGVDVPRQLQEGEHFDLTIDLNSNQPMQANVRVLEDQQVVFSQKQKLGSGDQTFSLPLIAGKTGFSRFQVQLDPQQDTFYQNNQLETYTQISGVPRILVVANPDSTQANAGTGTGLDEASQLTQALQASHLAVEKADPAALPASLAGLEVYSSVVLVDIPATSLSRDQMKALQGYVRDLGGGLAVVGGPNSYGIGGYFRTPLEEILPVGMQKQNNNNRNPTAAIVFAIDNSGSMDEMNNGVSKLDLVKTAALQAIDLLNPTDRVGVLAFSDKATWIVPVTDLTNLSNVKNAVMGIHSQGGTHILEGLQAVAASLETDPAQIKHAILLTDGSGDPTGINEVVQQMHDQNGITLTTIGVGNEAAAYLPQLAKLGGGRYYFTNDATHIPEIFSKETSLASQSYLIEHPFTPTQSNASPILSGIDTKSMPDLLGYVETTAKENSQKILVSDLGDPILSTWQYGLGRTAAFTSDATGHWAQEWLPWASYAQFWGQLVRYTTREETPSLFETRVELGSDQQARLIVDGQTEKGDLLNGYAVKAHIIAADGSSQVVDLPQNAPGQYTGQFADSISGVYLISVEGTPPQGSQFPQVKSITGWTVPYSAEYRNLVSDGKLLDQMAAVGNGTRIAMDENSAKGVFLHNISGGEINLPTWPWLVVTALVLLPIDIALRRLLIRPADLLKILQRFGIRPVKVERFHLSRFDGLMKIKQSVNAGRQNQAAARRKAEPDLKVVSPAAPAGKPTAAAPQRAEPKIPAKTAANLLASKKDRKRQ